MDIKIITENEAKAESHQLREDINDIKRISENVVSTIRMLESENERWKNVYTTKRKIQENSQKNRNRGTEQVTTERIQETVSLKDINTNKQHRTYLAMLNADQKILELYEIPKRASNIIILNIN